MREEKRMERWSSSEREKLLEMRAILGVKLTERAQYPDVVGDRRLLRFLRGMGMDAVKASEKYSKFLNWRDANEIDGIRNDILYGGKNDPHLFPCGSKILQCFPQIILAADACDNIGNPLSIERFNFSPSEALKNVTMKEYVNFAMYCLEYRVLVYEQLSNSKEQSKLAQLRRMCSNTTVDEPYGVILSSVYIRDFDGFCLDHFGADGQRILGSILELATANYPELLSLCQDMVN